jgi:2-octaprenyl-6-methoxyphenol hydroxylase
MIRIAGSGPVAIALLGLLLRQGFDRSEVSIDEPLRRLPDGLAGRTIALSLGSWQLLSRIIDPAPAAPIQEVDISLRGCAGSLRLGAAELGLPALGQVLRYGDLHRVLLDSAAMRSASGTAVAEQPGSFSITVIADGETGDDARTLDFGQSAILASVQTRGLTHGLARERFTREGPLALLPLPETDRAALVWCLPTALARERAALPTHDFARSLREAFGLPGADLTPLDAPFVAPLRRRLRRAVISGNEVAIGNAAQSLHPVAGQGLNLGLRDAFVLAQCLGDARASGATPASALQAYERARRADRLATVAITDTLARIFTWPVLHPPESLALGLLDIVPPARRAVARFFMFGSRL